MFDVISGVLSWINTHSKSSGTIEEAARPPKKGDIRISAYGVSEFTIERYTNTMWIHEYKGSKEDCDKWVDTYFRVLGEQRERDRKYYEAARNHRLANPTRYLRLEKEFWDEHRDDPR